MALPTLANTLRVRADQSNRANRDRQNDTEHYRILCDVLAVLLPQALTRNSVIPTPIRSCEGCRHSNTRTAPFPPERQWPTGVI
jgi:hypothetical protein